MSRCSGRRAATRTTGMQCRLGAVIRKSTIVLKRSSRRNGGQCYACSLRPESGEGLDLRASKGVSMCVHRIWCDDVVRRDMCERGKAMWRGRSALRWLDCEMLSDARVLHVERRSAERAFRQQGMESLGGRERKHRRPPPPQPQPRCCCSSWLLPSLPPVRAAGNLPSRAATSLRRLAANAGT